MKWQPAFGQVLKQRRLALEPRLTQEKLGEVVGRHKKTTRWETGRQMPRDQIILDVIAAVRAEPEELLQEVTALIAGRLRREHGREGELEPPAADEAVDTADEVDEPAAEWGAILPADSPADSIGPELQELHRAIDKVVVGFAAILASKQHR